MYSRQCYGFGRPMDAHALLSLNGDCRVLKMMRGSTGLGVWKLENAANGRVLMTDAYNQTTEELPRRDHTAVLVALQGGCHKHAVPTADQGRRIPIPHVQGQGRKCVQLRTYPLCVFHVTMGLCVNSLNSSAHDCHDNSKTRAQLLQGWAPDGL